MRERSSRKDRPILAERGRRRSGFDGILALARSASRPAGCFAGRAPDRFFERCLYVLEYRQPLPREVEVLGTTRSPTGVALTLHFEALAEPASEPVSDFIFCAFEPEER
jgi:hypothetical protein